MANTKNSGITNTERLVQEVPLYGVLMGDNAGINALERQGQTQAASSCMLPTKGLASYGPKGPWASLGFVIGDVDPHDTLFAKATLPPGWRKTNNQHPLYVDIRDDRNRVRVKFFYRGSFYDRSAHINPPNRRYSSQPDGRPYGCGTACYLILDTSLATWDDSGNVCAEAVLHKVECTLKEEGELSFELSDRAMELAKDWLALTYPNYEDPLAYWE